LGVEAWRNRGIYLALFKTIITSQRRSHTGIMVGSPLPGAQFEHRKWHRTMSPFPLNGSNSPKPDMFTIAGENKN